MSIALVQETRSRAHRACNEQVRENALPSDRVLPFICECEAAACCATVWMTPAEYDEARLYALPVLAEHHSVLETVPAPPAGAGEPGVPSLVEELAAAIRAVA